jgi:hypothetical protein
MKITKAQAQQLMIGVGGFEKKVVEAWKDDRLVQKVNKLPQLIDENKKVKDKTLAKLLKDVLAAKEEDEEITLAADKAAGKGGKGKPAPAPAKGGKGKGKAAVEDDDEEEEDDTDDEDEESDDDGDDEDDDADADEDESEDSDDDEDSDDEEESDADEEDGDDDSGDDGDDEEDSDEDDEDSDDDGDEDADDEDDDTESDEDEDESEDDEDEEDDDVETTKKKPGKKGGKASAKPSANGKAKEKGPGIIQTIADILATASEQKPLTKDKIHEKLCKKFPDRDKESMWTTVNLQVPNKLRTDKGINVQKNAKGYYIATGKVKPAAAKAEKNGKAKKKGKK